LPNVYTFKDFEGSSHRILMGLSRRYAKRGGTLLDLGAAGGELGAAVRDHFRRTLGFEYQVDCIADLKDRFDNVVANITVRIGLLFGIFEYRERGILDNTHLRFYTLRTIRRDLENAGFRVVAVSGSSIPIRLIVGRFTPNLIVRIGERILTILTRVWLSLFAYQIVVVATRE
jgi:hypothetical protein